MRGRRPRDRDAYKRRRNGETTKTMANWQLHRDPEETRQERRRGEDIDVQMYQRHGGYGQETSPEGEEEGGGDKKASAAEDARRDEERRRHNERGKLGFAGLQAGRSNIPTAVAPNHWAGRWKAELLLGRPNLISSCRIVPPVVLG